MQVQGENEDGNNSEASGKIRQHQAFVVFEDFTDDGVNPQEEKSTARIGQSESQPEHRDLMEDQPADETTDNGGGFDRRDQPEHFAAMKTTAQ